MLRAGTLILSVWCWLNVLPAAASLLFIAQGKHAPGLRMRFAPEEIPGIESRALAVVDGLATLANSLIAVYCITCFFVVRRSLLERQRWSFFVFASGALVLQAASYLADHRFFLDKNTLIIHGSSLVLVVGFSLCAVELFKRGPGQQPSQGS